MIVIKNERQIEGMRKSCKLAAETLEYIKDFVKEGISTLELNNLCHDFIIKNGAYPAPLNYQGFPKSICTSINNVVCHGIPKENDIIKNGDIINIDITVNLKGFFGDTSKTFIIGNVDEKIAEFVAIAEKAMYKGIEAIKPKAFLYEVGKAIEKIVAKNKFGIVYQYGGHGIGESFHEDPHVYHYYTPSNRIKLKPGMIFTVEPMINMGGDGDVITSTEDGWTVTTRDNGLSAQFEHTVLVTQKGYEILTKL